MADEGTPQTQLEALGPVCIIGMHRSGTSMVARLLQDAGLFLGPAEQLLGADGANPEGHFEHTGFLAINDALLRELGGTWDVPPRLAPGWESSPSLAGLRAAAESLISSFPAGRPWGWKEPRTTLLLPFWQSIVSHPRFVICLRSPLDVAKSLASRNRMTIRHGVHLWSQYLLAALQNTEGYPRHLAFYDDFFGADDAAVQCLRKFCGLESAGNPAPIMTGVRSDLRHHDTGVAELLDAPSVFLHAKLLYIGLRALAVWQPVSTATASGSNRKMIAQYVKLLDDFHSQGQLGQLETELAEKICELAGKICELAEKDLQIATLRNQLSELQQRADRLQTFSDAVRQTWAYRTYRAFIKPLRSN